METAILLNGFTSLSAPLVVLLVPGCSEVPVAWRGIGESTVRLIFEIVDCVQSQQDHLLESRSCTGCHSYYTQFLVSFQGNNVKHLKVTFQLLMLSVCINKWIKN